MKRTKLLLSAIVAMLLCVVMAFAVTACNNKGGGSTGNPDKSAGDLGITESSDETLALQYITVTGATTNFMLGQQFATGNIIVRAYYYDMASDAEVTAEHPDARQVITTITAADYTIDSSEYNPNRVGTYTIYVSYTFAGVTRTVSYNVTVKGTEPAIGGIRAEINKEVEEGITEYRLDDSLTEVEIKADRVVVYNVIAGENGSAVKGDLVNPENYTAKLYRGSKLIEDYIADENGVYTLEVALKSDATAKDFVTFKVANAVESIEFADGETEQPRSNRDQITGTWKFEATYANGLKKELTAASAGMQITYNPMQTGSQTVNIVYTEVDAFAETHSVKTSVEVEILPNTETLVIDYNFTAKQDETITNGSELVAGNSTAKAFGGDLAAGSSAKTFTDGKSFTYRVQGNKSKGVEFKLDGASLITVYYISGTSAQECWLGLYDYTSGSEELISIIGRNTGNSPLEPAVATLPAGTYRVHTHSDSPATSANIYAIEITTLIPPASQEEPIAIYTATFNENYTGAAVKTQSVIDYEGYNVAAGYTPARAGFAFEGWYTEAEGGDKVTFPMALTEDIQVYAHWTENDVTAIAAEKTNTVYVLTNDNITIEDWSDIKVTNATGDALSNAWAYSYKLYSDAACTAEVVNGLVEATGTYYIQVTAVKGENEKTLTTTVAIEVIDPADMTAKAGTASFMLSASGSVTFTAEELNLTLTAVDGDVLGEGWALAYELADADGAKVEGTDSWTVEAAGSYVLTVTATKGKAVLTATVTIVVNENSETATAITGFNTEDGNNDYSTAFGSETSISSPVELVSDDYVTATLTGSSSSATTINTTSSATINGHTYTGQMRTGGAGNVNQRSIKFEFAETVLSAKITVYAVTGSNGNARELALFRATGLGTGNFTTGNEAKVDGHEFNAADAYTYELNQNHLAEETTYYLGSTNSGINIYAFSIEYVYTSEPAETNTLVQKLVASELTATDSVADGEIAPGFTLKNKATTKIDGSTRRINLGGSVDTATAGNTISFVVPAGTTTITVKYYQNKGDRKVGLYKNIGADGAISLEKLGESPADDNNNTVMTWNTADDAINLTFTEETTLYIGSVSSGLYITEIVVTTVLA